MKKKLLSVLMVLCLILAMAPAAFAEGETEVDSAEALTSALQVGGNIKLTNDITVETKQEWTIGSGISVVLDLNNHTISSSYDEINYYVMVVNGGSLTITDSSENKGGKIVANDDTHGYGIQLRGTGSSFTLLGGTIETTQETLDIYTPANNTTVNISGGKLVSTADSVINVCGSGTIVNITGGEMTSDGRTGVYISNYGESDSILFTMTGGALTFSGGSSGAIQAYKGATLTIGENATISSTSYAIQAQENTVVNVEGGTLSTTGSYTIGADGTAEVNISGGKLTSPKYTITAEENAKINISGGDFTGGSQNFNIDEEDEESAVITVTGGTFKKTNGDADMSVGDYFPAHSDVSIDETTGIVSGSSETSVATVDGIGYSDFTNALGALKNGSTLTLRDSVSVTSQIAIDEDNVTFDGGGFTISAGDGFPASTDLILVTGDNVTVKNVILDGATHYGIQFYEAGNATIQDVTAQNNTSNGIHINASTVKAAGTIKLSNNGSYGMNLINVGFGSGINSAPGCSFDITSATLVGVDAIYSDSSDVTNSGSYGITITDGENEYVAVKDSAWPNFFVPQAVAEESAKITVTNGDKVTYYYNESSLQDAVAAADNGSTITLAPGTYDLGNDNGIVLNKKLTIQGSGEDTVIKGTGTADYGNGLFTFTGGSEGSVLKDLTINYTATGAQRAAVYFNDGFTGGSADNVTKIQNVDFVGGSLDNEKACGITSSYITGGYIEVSGCSFKNFAYGMYFNRVHDLTIEGNTIDGTRYNAINIAGDGDECSNIVIRDNTLTNISYANYDSDIYSSGINIGLAVSDVNIESNDITMLNGKEPINIVVAEDNTSKVTVTYTVNGSDYVVIVADVEDGKATYTEPADPAAPQGYKFDGWAYTGAVSVSGNTVTLTVGDTYEYTFAAKFSAIEVDPPEKPDHPSRPVGPTYDIDVVDAENGSVSANLSNASEGSTIRLTVEPDEGYELGSLTVTGPDGRVEVTRVNASTYRFTMPDGDVTVRATFVSEGLPFTDVSTSAWYYDAVSYVYANGLMDGVSSTQFNPDGTMTRAMVWAILARIDGQTVTGDGWIETAREWAVAEGVSDGENANSAVTREQLVTMLWRYAGEPEGTAPLSAWSDAGSVSDWAAEAMSWAIDNGVITGMSADTLAPQGSATRAQCAAILMRCADLLA